jgi:hypothetical protein
MYFKDFPNFLYDFKYGDTLKTSIVTDITRNVRVRKEILSSVTIYDEYDIEDGETPEIIAEKIYGDAKYHWVVMLSNDAVDYLTDFPLEEHKLVKVIQDKYTNINAIHHYENSDGFVVNSDDPDAYPVSNNEYERRLNETKRRIKLVSPKLLNTILKNFKDLL